MFHGSLNQGVGSGEWGVGSGEQGTGNRERGTGNREQGTGFPPDAYPLGPEHKAALAALPDTNPSLNWEGLQIIPFPAFEASGLKDYAGRSVAESLEAVRELTGLQLSEFHVENAVTSPEPFDNNKNNFLGKEFWSALARGGYQGAVYYIEKEDLSQRHRVH